MWKKFNSIRSKMTLIVLIVIFLLIGFEIYIFVVTNDLSAQIRQSSSQTDLNQLALNLHYMSEVAFWLLSGTLLFASSMLFYNLLSISQSFKTLLRGIHGVEEGHLESRVKIHGQNEFSEIAKFFNRTADTIQAQVEQKTSELDAERNLLALVFGAVQDGIIAVDTNNKIATINQSAIAILGKHKSELLGQDIAGVLQLFSDEKQLDIELLIHESRKKISNLSFDSDDLILRRKNKKPVDVEIAIQSARAENGSSICVITMRNLTEQKELERMKLDFVAMAAHQLRTPITTMRGYLNLMKHHQSPSAVKEYMQKINNSSETLYRLVGNLLNASKVEDKTLAFELKKIDIQDTAQTLIRELNDGYAKEQNVEIKLTRFKKNTCIFGDQFYIREALANLLNNAIRYSKPHQKIALTIDETKDRVLICVKDHGTGIPKTALKKLFTKFYQVQDCLDSGSRGTGLGLFITRQIIEQHGGKVWVQSTLGKGSTFYISLPLYNDNIEETVVSNGSNKNSDTERKNYGWIKKRTSS